MSSSTNNKKKRAGHVRVLCPHCNREVNVQRLQGFAKAMPCPNCRRPIAAATITAADAESAPEGEA